MTAGPPASIPSVSDVVTQWTDRLTQAFNPTKPAAGTGQTPAPASTPTGAPHTAASLLVADWPQAYSREDAAYPKASLRHGKYWSPVGRVDNVWGDRNLSCSCPPMASYED